MPNFISPSRFVLGILGSEIIGQGDDFFRRLDHGIVDHSSAHGDARLPARRRLFKGNDYLARFSTSCFVGVNAWFTISTCLGWMQNLPNMPSARHLSALAARPS